MTIMYTFYYLKTTVITSFSGYLTNFNEYVYFSNHFNSGYCWIIFIINDTSFNCFRPLFFFRADLKVIYMCRSDQKVISMCMKLLTTTFTICRHDMKVWRSTD